MLGHLHPQRPIRTQHDQTAVVASNHSSLHSPLQYSRTHRHYIFALDVSLLLHMKGGWPCLAT